MRMPVILELCPPSWQFEEKLHRHQNGKCSHVICRAFKIRSPLGLTPSFDLKIALTSLIGRVMGRYVFHRTRRCHDLEKNMLLWGAGGYP